MHGYHTKEACSVWCKPLLWISVALDLQSDAIQFAYYKSGTMDNTMAIHIYMDSQEHRCDRYHCCCHVRRLCRYMFHSIVQS